ncbi:hypothetical protein HDU76_004284 [Blyttiomyces sp. JEL0837]|nr:hypothetical protein HDU76_004284 [Blyttiomyces sp. JEL0837]
MPAINLAEVRAAMLNDSVVGVDPVSTMVALVTTAVTAAVTDSITPTATATSTPTSTLTNLAGASAPNTNQVLKPVEQTVINFAAYMMIQGVFLGTTTLFLHRAVNLYIAKRNWLTFADVLQLLLWLTRNIIIITFNIAPGWAVDCSWRQYAAGVASSSVIVCVWWLQYIKFQSMYQDKPWICRIVLGICVIALAATFPYVKTQVKLDSLDHCSVSFDPSIQAAYISSDVVVNILLSTLFAVAIWKHVSSTDKTWSSYSKLTYILTCDVRASFIDTLAQLIKLGLNLSPSLPGSQTVFGSHVCDWIKVCSAHWFVNDVVKHAAKTDCPTCSQRGNAGGAGAGGGAGTASIQPPGSIASSGSVMVSIRRKGSVSVPVTNASGKSASVMTLSSSKDKEKEGKAQVVKSHDTLKDADGAL